MKRLLTFFTFIVLISGCSSESDNWEIPVIPVSLKDIETVNIDNSGEFPVIAESQVKKEAYMIGVKWIADNKPTEDDDKFVTDPIWKGDYTYASLSHTYLKAIKCNTNFNADIPAGTYVSGFFKEINRSYLPKDVNEGFVLLMAPDPGEHSFRIEYYEGEEVKFFRDTQLINFY